MQRIFFIARHFTVNSGSYAGFIEEVSKYASNHDYKVLILCAKIDKTLPDYEKHGFGEVIRFNIPLGNAPLLGMNKDYFFLGRQVKRYLKEQNITDKDILICNGRGALGVPKGHKYILRMVQPAFVFLKNMEIAKDYVSPLTRVGRAIHFTLQHFLERSCVKNAAGFIFSSAKSRDLTFTEFDVKAMPCFIPHSGIKYDEFQHGKRIMPPGKKILFVSAGDEKIRKGIIYLEKALPYIFDKYKGVNLLHVGKNVIWDVDERYRKRIISVGNVPWNKMKDYYASCDFVVSCALNEAIPNVVFEAMASGCPVLSSDTEGINEAISHKKDGYIYGRGDVEGLKKGLCYMIENTTFRKKAGKLLKIKAKHTNSPVFSKRLLEFSENVNSGGKTSVNLLKQTNL